MMVSKRREKAMLSAVSTLLRLLRKAFLVTKRVRVMPVSRLPPYGHGQRYGSVATAYLMAAGASTIHTSEQGQKFRIQAWRSPVPTNRASIVTRQSWRVLCRGPEVSTKIHKFLTGVTPPAIGEMGILGCVKAATRKRRTSVNEGGKPVQLILEAKSDGEVPVLQCRGRIVYRDEASALTERSYELLRKHQRLLVDLNQVENIDSGGLGALVMLQMWARQG